MRTSPIITIAACLIVFTALAVLCTLSIVYDGLDKLWADIFLATTLTINCP